MNLMNPNRMFTLIFKIYVKDETPPIEERRELQSHNTLENRLHEILNFGVFKKNFQTENSNGGTWYPPHRIEKVEYRQINNYEPN